MKRLNKRSRPKTVKFELDGAKRKKLKPLSKAKYKQQWNIDEDEMDSFQQPINLARLLELHTKRRFYS